MCILSQIPVSTRRYEEGQAAPVLMVGYVRGKEIWASNCALLLMETLLLYSKAVCCADTRKTQPGAKAEHPSACRWTDIQKSHGEMASQGDHPEVLSCWPFTQKAVLLKRHALGCLRGKMTTEVSVLNHSRMGSKTDLLSNKFSVHRRMSKG